MSNQIVIEGNLTYQYCPYETGLDGYKIDDEWLGDAGLDKLFDANRLKDGHGDDRYTYIISYGRVRITIERIESEQS